MSDLRSQVGQIVDEYRSGAAPLHEVHADLSRLVEFFEVDAVIQALPESIRGGFVEYLRGYRWTESPEQIICISSGGRDRPADVVFYKIKEWLDHLPHDESKPG